MTNLRAWLEEKSPEEIEHFLEEIPRLWLEGGEIEKLYKLLSNYEFIEAKINHPQFGIKLLLEDYYLIDNLDLLSYADHHENTIESLKLIKKALRLSVHILTEDKTQLAGQLSARLLDFDTPEIKNLLQQIEETKTTCLRSFKASLSPPTGGLLSTLSGHGNYVNAVAVTPDDTRIISASSDHTVKVWDLSTGAEIRTLIGHSAPVNAVAVTPDGTRVISGASDNTVRVWSLATGKEILRFNGHSLPVNAVAVTPDGKKVVSASIAKYNSIKVWDLETGKEELTLKGHQQKVTSLTVTPDGKHLISGSDDKTIKIWNLETRKECFTLIGHSDSINTLSITPDGKYVVSGSNDKTIKIWDLEQREEIFTFTGHTESVNRIKVTSNGKFVISASSDKTIQVWDFETRKVVAKFTGESAINCCAVAPDNMTIVAGEAEGNIHFLRLQGI